MRCFYLDAVNEKGSKAILEQLGVLLRPSRKETNAKDDRRGNAASGAQRRKTLPLNRLDSSHQERRASIRIAYTPLQDGLDVDVRDEADCWLRIPLEAEDTIEISANLSHRLHTDKKEEVSYILEHPEEGEEKLHFHLRYSYDAQFGDGEKSLLSRQDVLTPHRVRELTCELCRQFFECGWVTGTGGSISIRYGNRIYMTPSGVQKERIAPEDIFLLDTSGEVLSFPPQKTPNKIPKLTDCSPLFFHAYRLRNAGAVIHSHDITCVLVSTLFPGTEYKVSRQEMIKGIAGHGYLDELVIPIIENTPKESELADSLELSMKKHPKACAVLVRDHGIYVWGDSWEAAKRHSECLHYLFKVSIEMHKLGIPHSPTPPANGLISSVSDSCNASRKRKLNSSCCGGSTAALKHVLLDIEGTTTPISFVKEVLFPYSTQHMEAYLKNNIGTPQTEEVVKELQALMKAEGFACNEASEPYEQVAKFAKSLIQEDRKVSALKRLQGFIWKQGYQDGVLQATVFEDVPPFLQAMQQRGVSVSIYSSGSRGAQQLLFQYSSGGDLRPLLSSYFDTSVGHKRESSSYEDILLTLGLKERPEEVVFVTDILDEAMAAARVGMRAVLSVRPGNADLPSGHGFPEITSFDQILSVV